MVMKVKRLFLNIWWRLTVFEAEVIQNIFSLIHGIVLQVNNEEKNEVFN